MDVCAVTAVFNKGWLLSRDAKIVFIIARKTI